jgi:heme-degrading monooxygenase HmoA
MYARIVRFEGARPDQAEVAKRLGEEEFAPMLRKLDGFAGFAMLGDIESGAALDITFFESEETLHAGDRAMNEMSPPDELSNIRRTSVELYEVTLHEVTGEAAAARISRLEGPPEAIDEGTRYAEENVVPKVRQIEGWRGLFAFSDRASGKSVVATLWESAEALDASEEAANQLRTESADAFGDTIAGVERYEVLALEVPARATT